MTRTLQFTIKELIPYINWVYFYHAWGVNAQQGEDVRREADTMLARWAEEHRHTAILHTMQKAVF